MRASLAAVMGVLSLFLAGFIRGGERYSNDPELVYGGSYALAACGALGVLVAGVAWGIALSRDQTTR